MVNFVSVVSNIKSEVQDEVKSLQIEQKQSEKLEWEYYNVLIQVLQLLVEILQNYKINKQAQVDQVAIKWLHSKAQTMIRKLSVLQTQIIADTYTPMTVPALQTIRYEGFRDRVWNRTEGAVLVFVFLFVFAVGNI